MTTRTVAVTGAGLGGLTAALALRKRGFDVTVFEQASELREVGAGVQPEDILKFKDSKRYKDRLAQAQKATGEKDALVVLAARIALEPKYRE